MAIAKLFKAHGSSPSDLVTPSELETAFAEFIKIDVADGNASSDTIRTYAHQMRQYLLWCQAFQINPATATRRQIKQYRHWMVEIRQYQPATIALKLTAVRRFYDAAIEQGLLTINPALGIKPPRDKKDLAEKITYLETEEARTFLDAIPNDNSLKSLRDLAMLYMMTLEGTRTIEMHRANIGDVVQQGQNVGVRVEGKSNIRIVPLTPEIAGYLLAYLQKRQEVEGSLTPNKPLFISTSHHNRYGRLSRKCIRDVVNGYLLQEDLKYKPGRTLSAHSLRHTAGTLALRAGADLRQVQDLLGHADPRMTAIYAHIGDRWKNNPALKLNL